MELLCRPRRNRKHPLIRHWRGDASLSPKDLVYPVFIVKGTSEKQEIKSLPGQFRWSVDNLPPLCEKALKRGIGALALFPVIEKSLKNPKASEALNEKGLICHGIREIKKRFPELIIITDIALDPFSSQGHDGLVENSEIVNDKSVKILSDMAVLHAHAGADIVAPSDMMDGRVLAIRQGLDKVGFTKTSILSYCVKYASNFYSPFRIALDSNPKTGDKKTYQMDPASQREALLECRLDEQEGADILMVKPALSYLDIVHKLRECSYLPIAAYNVSGEYTMIKAAGAKGWLNEAQCASEVLLSIKRAGAQVIFTYFALDETLIFR